MLDAQREHAGALFAKTEELIGDIGAGHVAEAFRRGCPRWKTPADRHCSAIASAIRLHVAERDQVWRAETKANLESASRLYAAIARDLPPLAERLLAIVAPGEHAEAVADLVAAAERFRTLWVMPNHAPKMAKDWHALAHLLAPEARFALERANQPRRVGLPRSAQSPLARALAELLTLAGCSKTLASPAAIGRHFQTHWPGPK